ncbi:hypothetical protein [Chryseobacterium vrystaatense]|uniref:Uncharacterized protein n=1 Tax=Chryseobacterium vrystaatense TaxID=307480 RepID=A0A1M5H701_9FLAO|nr:hypothetical protein [Chryseobacterium vrystaatense]KFF24431.1 hypothetical protein IW16_19075 [Chryseobacterium vrystaatense]SHG11685.1 hypothetical protein SAMN02787073_3599 [Chryseobacterium vrystaatense]
MEKKEISFLVSLSDAPSPVLYTKEKGRDRLIALKNQLEEMDIQVEHLQTLGQLVIHAPEEVWNKAIVEIASLKDQDFQIEPNRLL